MSRPAIGTVVLLAGLMMIAGLYGQSLDSPTVARLPDGREILVNPDGTWEFVAQRQAAMGSPAAEQPSQADLVYVTRTGTKYHRANCRHVARSKIGMPLKEALGRYGPCSVCKPPTAVRSGAASPVASTPVPAVSSTKPLSSAPAVTRSTPKTSSGGGQCRATTKKGVRCSRAAKPGSAYCWQHGG